MLLEQSNEDKLKFFQQHLLITNRGFNFYIDWSNVDLRTVTIELHAMDALIRKQDDFDEIFFTLLDTVPTVVRVFPFLFALAKEERKATMRGVPLNVVGTEIDSEDLQQYGFCGNGFLNEEEKQRYLDFFKQMGLKNLFQNMLEKSTYDYVTGVLVGLDSNGRKNRGGSAFELACEPVIREICKGYGIEVITQKQFKTLQARGFQIDADVADRKADFILIKGWKCMNIEVNFFSGAGSKPEEIIDSYINRQRDLGNNQIEFALITDGQCWNRAENQLRKGFRHLNYLLNFKMLKSGYFEEMVRKIFVD